MTNADWIRSFSDEDLADWLEMERDQLITSLLDNQACEDEKRKEES